MQQKTLGKIQVFGTGGWKEVRRILDKSVGSVLIFQPLLRSVPADILPAQWGGTKDGEGICMGGEVTEEYIQQSNPEEIPG